MCQKKNEAVGKVCTVESQTKKDVCRLPHPAFELTMQTPTIVSSFPKTACNSPNNWWAKLSFVFYSSMHVVFMTPAAYIYIYTRVCFLGCLI